MSSRTPLTGPVVWRGDEIKNSSRWIRTLTPDQVDELDAALKSVRSMKWSEITGPDVWLPTLDELFDDIADELENGCGIVKLRGLPVDRYDEEDLRRLYFAIGTHIGTPVFQNRSGELMRAVSLKVVPTAILSRQIAGVRGNSLIVNLPGKPSAIRDCLLAVFPAIPYCVDLIEGPYLTTNEAVVKAFRPKSG